MLDLYFLEKWFFKVIWPYLNCNHLIYYSKNPTKVWRYHVMSLNHFCAIIYLIHCIFWAPHPIFFSGPVGNFALQLIWIFLSSFHQNYGRSVGACYPSLCKNLKLFFEKFECFNLISILDQLEDLYSSHHFSCSYNLDYFSYL